MRYGKLETAHASEKPELLAASTVEMLAQLGPVDVRVAQIDPQLADTAAFCEQYEIGLDHAANCLIVEASRGDRTWRAACVVLATTRADVNGLVRRHLDARRVSFLPMDKAVPETKMEYGGITPIGLPSDWPILIDARVVATDWVVIGSGIWGSKIFTPGSFLAKIPNAVVLDGMAR